MSLLTTCLRSITTPRAEQLELLLDDMREPIEHDCEIDGHEWERYDESFGHAFGTEIVIGYCCAHCDETRTIDEIEGD
jgi:hypothetical protein